MAHVQSKKGLPQWKQPLSVLIMARPEKLTRDIRAARPAGVPIVNPDDWSNRIFCREFESRQHAPTCAQPAIP
jgi:hypothetical protein